MKILLLHPPVDYYMPALYRTEPLGLGYIASVLRRDGHDVEVFDAHLRCLTPKQAVEEILKRDFDCLGITGANDAKKVMISTARAIRKQRKDAIMTAGGYLPTLCADYLLKECPEFDFLVRGEGENVASDVFGRIARGEEWRDTTGIAYLSDGEPILNPLPPLIQNLDSLPFPARDALKQSVSPISAGISSSRGCCHQCSFCCIQSFYRLYQKHAPRYRNPQNVVDEIESVIAETGITEFRFVDDDFIGVSPRTRERAIGIADEIKSRKLNIKFKIECRADVADREVLRAMKEAGLTEVFLGVESGVQRQLDTYNKHTTVEQNRDAIEMVRKCGITLRAGFIMFDPYITVKELQENLRFAKEMGIIDEAKRMPIPFVTKLIIHRGVPLVEKLREDGLLRENGVDVDYVFNDPAVRLIHRALLLISGCSDIVNYLKQRFAFRKSRCKTV